MSEKEHERFDDERREAFLRRLRDLLRKLSGGEDDEDNEDDDTDKERS
jgi:hypothetical protein